MLCPMSLFFFFFFFQAEDGIRDYEVTGVQTCALPIWSIETQSLKVTVSSCGAGLPVLEDPRRPGVCSTIACPLWPPERIWRARASAFSSGDNPCTLYGARVTRVAALQDRPHRPAIHVQCRSVGRRRQWARRKDHQRRY